MNSEEIKATYSMRDILILCGLPRPNRAGFIRCPFHPGDREASLKIYEHDYHCFACGAHGDIFDFYQRVKGLSFREAFFELGGSYEDRGVESRFVRQKRKMEIHIRKAEAAETDRKFRKWRRNRLAQVCNVLQLCDNAQGLYEPFSWEWGVLLNLKQINQYKYEVLAFGSGEEQEEMRRLDE